MFNLNQLPYDTVNDPEGYLIEDRGLVEAVNMAIVLQKPLLICGNPGSGKTQLAFKIAAELAKKMPEGDQKFAPFLAQPFVFNTKSSSAASDLFYYYDAIRHFQNKKPEDGESTAYAYIQFNALGKAIIQAMGRDRVLAEEKLWGIGATRDFEKEILPEPRSSVVLIDEIDKASQDFPNDLLNEIEYYEFRINEVNVEVKKDREQTPLPVIIVVMTSNVEKNLPEAFLRRCLFYHIKPPDLPTLQNIVTARMNAFLKKLYPEPLAEAELKVRFEGIREAVRQFGKLQTHFQDKVPATAELLEWLRVLELHRLFDEAVDFEKLTGRQSVILRYTLPILAKSEQDMRMLETVFKV